MDHDLFAQEGRHDVEVVSERGERNGGDGDPDGVEPELVWDERDTASQHDSPRCEQGDGLVEREGEGRAGVSQDCHRVRIAGLGGLGDIDRGDVVGVATRA